MKPRTLLVVLHLMLLYEMYNLRIKINLEIKQEVEICQSLAAADLLKHGGESCDH